MSGKNMFDQNFLFSFFNLIWFLQSTFPQTAHFWPRESLRGDNHILRFAKIKGFTLLLVHSAQLGSQNATLTVIRLDKF